MPPSILIVCPVIQLPALLETKNETKFAICEQLPNLPNGMAIPLGKLGSCSQIANLVSFLVSSNAGNYITGQTISIDGGMSI